MSTPSATPGTPPLHQIDQYRTLPNVLKRPLLRFSASAPTPIAEETAQALLGVSSTSYTARLSARNVLLVDTVATGPAADEQERRDLAVRRGRKGCKHGGDGESGKGKGKGRRRKVGLLGREEARLRRVWEVKDTQIRYDHLLPLHYMHLSYLSEMIPLPAYPTTMPPAQAGDLLPSGKLANGVGCEQMASRLLKADFTGALVRVKRAKNGGLEGMEGIVLQETAGTFRLVTRGNVVKVVPKVNALFTISFPAYAFPTLPHAPLPGQVFTQEFMHAVEAVPRVEVDLLGEAFGFRAEERAGRKFKFGAGGGGWGEEWVGGGGLFEG